MFIRIIILSMLLQSAFIAKGKVYVVMGSDTGIWEGLDVSKYYHTYNPGLYTDPNRNAYQVMSPNFRNTMLDSRGTPLKMTWWMMSGNTFRHAINTNVPDVNSITFYLMRKYHGDMIELFGDEISLHYHTWEWTDLDGDGIYWWNQAPHFDRFKEDFEYTLAQNLIDANEFPVSYRSGWHYMDNEWQNYLENILPFSMHNDYPNKHDDTIEPTDNLYDWSQAPGEFVPYHPSSTNYQIPGDLNGWDLRSIYMTRATPELIDGVFQKASDGTDQMICIWAHLPETDFLDNIQKVHSVLSASDAKFADVEFIYCSAVEAMQLWLGTGDTSAPKFDVTEEFINDELYFNISVDENLFQDFPFVSSKDVYKRYKVLPLTQTGVNSWRTALPVSKSLTAKVGFAVTDESGNLSKKFINYFPDEIFIDENDERYYENYGNWSTSDSRVWDEHSRIASIQHGDSASAGWTFSVDTKNRFSVFTQFPKLSSPVDSIRVILSLNETPIFSKSFSKTPYPDKWIYLGSVMDDVQPGKPYILSVTGYNNSEEDKLLACDILKISALIRDRELNPSVDLINFGSVSQLDSAEFNLILENTGVEELTISNVMMWGKYISVDVSMPIVIPAMGSEQFNLKFHSPVLGSASDTLYLYSNDPLAPVYKIPVSAHIEPPFFIVDNEDVGNYQESGTWSTSVAQAYGMSSRYSLLNQTPKAYAEFSINQSYGGNYLIQSIVPKTENSTDKAKYVLNVNGINSDSVLIDQNNNSGGWVNVFNAYIPENSKVTVKIIDSGLSTTGVVLRADAIKFQLLESITSVESDSEGLIRGFSLLQNYPNPFNPTTTIEYTVPEINNLQGVQLVIYNILGQLVAQLVNTKQQAGQYQVTWEANSLPSGVYFYKLTAGSFSQVKKMMLMK